MVRAPVPPVIDHRNAFLGPPWQSVGKLGMDTGVSHQPTAERCRSMGPATACERGERGAVVRPSLGKHLRLVIAGEHHIERLDSEPSHLQIGLPGSAPIEQVADLNDPEAAAALLARVQRTERA